MRPEQRMGALAVAQAVRLDGVTVKREIAAGSLTVADALADPRSGSLTVLALLSAQVQWGSKRSLRLLRADRIREDLRVRDLTEPQRRMIVARLETTPRAEPPKVVAVPSKLVCVVCGNPLRRPSADWMCGFCREELAA